MKKMFFLLCISFSAVVFAQMSALQINNYSNYLINGRLRANDVTNCLPEIYVGNTLGTGNFTIPPATSTTYNKYYTSNTAAVPIFEYHVRMSYTGSSMTLDYNNSIMTTISPTTDWSMFSFFVRDPITYDIHDHFTIGVAPCAGNYPTYQLGTQSETEWFTISSGGTMFSYINIY